MAKDFNSFQKRDGRSPANEAIVVKKVVGNEEISDEGKPCGIWT